MSFLYLPFFEMLSPFKLSVSLIKVSQPFVSNQIIHCDLKLLGILLFQIYCLRKSAYIKTQRAFLCRQSALTRNNKRDFL